MKSEATISKNGRSSERRRADQAVDAKPSVARRAAKAPSAAAGLPAIPRVGPVRIQALAAAGITTLDQLRAMSVEQIGAVKWVGIGNARLIKAWIARQDSSAADDGRLAAAPSSTPTKAAKTPKGAAKPALRILSHDDAEMPPGRVSILPPPPPDLGEAAAPATHTVDAGVDQIDSAIGRLKEATPRKKLVKQLAKLETAVSSMPASIEKLRGRDQKQAARALDRISEVLAGAVESGTLSAKKQEAIYDDLKKARKRLDKALGS